MFGKESASYVLVLRCTMIIRAELSTGTGRQWVKGKERDTFGAAGAFPGDER